jgi:alcohol dehydrogenase
MNTSFQFTIPTKVFFGYDKFIEISSILDQCFISRPLIVTDNGIIKTGSAEKLSSFILENGRKTEIFSDVEPNPSIHTVEKALQSGQEYGFDGIIALGGGSPMDVAKTVAIRANNDVEVGDLEGLDKFTNNPLPVMAIPTTAGTGSEVTPFAVITDTNKNYKLTIFSNRILPVAALLDGSMVTNLPAPLAASTGLDALTHAIEAYTSLFSSSYSDAFAEKAIRMIGSNLLKFVSNRKNIQAANNMLLASLFAGLAFGHARLGNAHAMAHPLGGYFNVPHGVANAILLPYIMEYNKISCPEKFEVIAELLSKPSDAKQAINAVREMNSELEIPEKLTNVGVDPNYIQPMAKDAMKSGNIQANPRQSTIKDIELLYEKACT